uniref:Cysteine-rich motor neuron 1 protein-like isoform X2 n=1 Tax=Crassostrea virginica TaxID=6565 RepID=A0A8B8BLA6_CRAVI|nr:cysteine-rich motor neuron 1 protein-like isoform X2 [Crassostrea virginica]
MRKVSVFFLGFTILQLLSIYGGCDGFLFCSLYPMFCSLSCQNGYAKDSNGCTLCKCATTSDSSETAAANSHANPVSTSGYHHPCLPHQQFCPLTCPEGFVNGSGGCQFCICYQSNVTEPTTQPPPTTPGVRVHMTNPCIQNQTLCDKFCGEGYLLGPDGCQYCLCRNLIPGLVYTKAPSTTPSSETTTLAYYLPNPCQDGQHVCSANCQYGFILGPGNCQYCMCAAKTTPSLMTTTVKPAGSDVAPSTTPFPSGHMDNECAVAFTICQIKCKHGFLADTVDCRRCVCKDEIYKSG